MGIVHTFVLPSLLTERDSPPFTLFIRRLIHYMHNGFVMDDSSDREHLPSLSTMDGVRDLFALATIAIFLNVLDERTYQYPVDSIERDPAVLKRCHDAFDLNAIPVVERCHLCYTRGLAFDLVDWVYENFTFSSLDSDTEDVNGHDDIFVPFVIHIGRQIIQYKRIAEEHGHTTTSTLGQVARQIKLALFGFESLRDAWEAAERKRCSIDADLSEECHDLDYDIDDYIIAPRQQPGIKRFLDSNFLEAGKTIADERFFRGLASQFKSDNFGNVYVYHAIIALRLTVSSRYNECNNSGHS